MEDKSGHLYFDISKRVVVNEQSWRTYVVELSKRVYQEGGSLPDPTLVLVRHIARGDNGSPVPDPRALDAHSRFVPSPSII